MIDLKFALPWHQDCYQGIMRYGQEHGWRCTLDLYAAGIEGDLTNCPYDGVVGRVPGDLAEQIRGLGVPVSNLAHYASQEDDDRTEDLPGVYIDRDAGIWQVVSHLSQVGYSYFSFITIDYEFRKLLPTARKACQEHGMRWVEPLSIRPATMQTRESYAEQLRSIYQWVGGLDHPIGVFATDTTRARQMAHACLESSKQVPEDVGIACLAGDLLTLISGSPTISSVDYDFFAQGYKAAAVLDKLMQGKPIGRKQEWLGPTELTVRDSTDVFMCEDELVSEAMRYVAAHVREDVSVQSLAEALEVSESTLHRRFDETLGRRPLQEINRIRLDYIKRLLSETSKPIAQVGVECDFSTASHFTRFFKRLSGETPSAYRERNQRRDGTVGGMKPAE